tara:strand:- start:47336 stop:47989 length:654 start_codon:yes stop_codon:yes gene_type:complete
MKKDYDELYREFRENGSEGWGGPSFRARTNFLKKSIQTFLSELPKGEAVRTLDLGCGAGELTQYLTELGYDAVGMDLSSEAIEWAKNRHPNLVFFQGDALGEMNWGGKYHLIVDSHTIHCITGSDRSVLAQNVYNHLMPGGLLLINHMVGDLKEEISYGSFDVNRRLQIRGERPYRYMPESWLDLKSEWSSFGFEVVKHWVSSGSPWDCAHILMKRI